MGSNEEEEFVMDGEVYTFVIVLKDDPSSVVTLRHENPEWAMNYAAMATGNLDYTDLAKCDIYAFDDEVDAYKFIASRFEVEGVEEILDPPLTDC